MFAELSKPGTRATVALFQVCKTDFPTPLSLSVTRLIFHQSPSPQSVDESMICASGNVRVVCLYCEPRTTISMARKVSKIIVRSDRRWPPIRGHAQSAKVQNFG
jgi:hypothetical protein